MRRRARWARAALLAVVSVAASGVFAPLTANAAGTLQGDGSSFAAIEFQQWTAATAVAPYNLSVNYTSNSSGNGRSDYANGLVQFGASDIIYQSQEDGAAEVNQANSAHPFKYVTVSAGGLGFMYNLTVNGVQQTGLNLSRQDVCEIFTGEVTHWSALANTAPGDTFLSQLAGTAEDNIKPITRSDQAGESYVLSQYCQAVDPSDWTVFQNWVDANAQQINYSDPNMALGLPVSTWPAVLYNFDQNTAQASGADNVADDVQSATEGAGSITYDAAAYAKVRGNWPQASVQNAANQYTQPTPNAAQAALAYASANQAGTFNLDFTGSDPTAYFPSTYSYALAPTNLDSTDSANLAEFFCYAVGSGQNAAISLAYAPLSQAVTGLSVNAIEAMPGAPPVSNCGIGGPEPVVGTPAGVTPPPVVTPPPAVTGPTTTTPGSSGTTTPGSSGTTTPGSSGTTTPGSSGTTTPGSSGTTTPGSSGGSAGPGGNGSSGAQHSATNNGGPGSTTPTTTCSGTATSTTTSSTAEGSSTAGSTTTTTTPCLPPPADGGSSAGNSTTPMAGSSSAGGTSAVTYASAFNAKAALAGKSQGSSSLEASNAVATNEPTNSEALWWLLIGAGICALVTGAAGARRRMAS